jgi:hypothetical protein
LVNFNRKRPKQLLENGPSTIFSKIVSRYGDDPQLFVEQGGADRLTYVLPTVQASGLLLPVFLLSNKMFVDID